jgi:lipoprotein NlpI
MAHLVAKNYEESLRWFGKALELNSRYAVAYSGRCMAYRLLGRDPLAQANAAAAADRDSDLRNRPCLAEDVYRFWERSSAEF